MTEPSADMRKAAEEAFGCRFAEFSPIGLGNSSDNFRAAMPDGKLYFVKFATRRHVKLTLDPLKAISSPLVPRPAFGGATGKFGNLSICAIEWLESGKNIPPHLLTHGQIAGIRDGYEEFSSALSAIPCDSLNATDGLAAAAASCAMEPRTVHGDFTYRNFFMKGDALVACFDLECIRRGLPTEDLMNIFVHEMERTRFWRISRLAALKRNFAYLVSISQYPASAWLAAIDLYELRKSSRRAQKQRVKAFAAIERFFRAPLYAQLRRTVRSAAAGK